MICAALYCFVQLAAALAVTAQAEQAVAEVSALLAERESLLFEREAQLQAVQQVSLHTRGAPGQNAVSIPRTVLEACCFGNGHPCTDWHVHRLGRLPPCPHRHRLLPSRQHLRRKRRQLACAQPCRSVRLSWPCTVTS